MDGTLVDTERCHAYAIHKTIKKQRPDFEISLENTFKYIIGLTDHTVYKHLIQDEILIKMTWDEFIEAKDVEFFKYIKDIKIEDNAALDGMDTRKETFIYVVGKTIFDLILMVSRQNFSNFMKSKLVFENSKSENAKSESDVEINNLIKNKKLPLNIQNC